MVNYQLGKIYRIVCNTTGLVYVGSTCEPTLAKRLQAHKSHYKHFLKNNETHLHLSSYRILENDNYEIILIEKCPCDSKDELHQRERFYIESMDCVNKNVPGRTKEDDIAYRRENKEIIKERGKKYYDEQREIILEKKKEYAEINKERIKEYQVKYREENKEALKDFRKKKYAEMKRKNIENATPITP
jgi:hypothetical protein